MASTALTVVGDNTAPADGVPNRRGYWQDQITKAEKRYDRFRRNGSHVVDKYRMEREDASADNTSMTKDRYNILYSSTETTRPSLYATTPKVQATKRHRDREDEKVTMATLLLETATQYAMEEIDFDEVMNNVIEDYLLPGLGQAWIRYVPTFKTNKGANDNENTESLAFEGLDVDYVHYKDFLTGPGRIWKELPWVARRVYFTKERAAKRFGAEKAEKLQYSFKPDDDGESSRESVGLGGAQSIVFEIWDREKREVVFYSPDYADDVLETRPDPLKLKDFFPCPRPLRAVSVTKTFIPKAFYSQYKAQADALDDITQRIRVLTEALRVVGVYDASQEGLAQLLMGTNNKMVPVQNWAAFAGTGGMDGAVQFLSIKDISVVLTELYRQRDIAKNEIYEITGFSDIVRGVSKASETLGAQQIKSDWATGRLRSLQKEVQRFCRDIIRIMAEIIAEQFSEDSLAMYAGFEPPPVTPEEQQAAQAYAAAQMMPPQPGQPVPQPPGPTMRQQAIRTFLDVVELLKNEKMRCASIGIETDSTIMPDEAKEREDRMAYLAAIGAFLQQAGPMALQFPDMRGLLGAIMMFTIRTFRASRPLEKEFEEFNKKLAAAPPQNPNGEQTGDNGEAAANAQVEGEKLKQQTAQQQTQVEDATARYKIDKETQLKRDQMQMDHDFRMAELDVKRRELEIKEAELGLKRQEVQHNAAMAEDDQQHRQDMDHDAADREDRAQEMGQQNADADREAAAEAVKTKAKQQTGSKGA